MRSPLLALSTTVGAFASVVPRDCDSSHTGDLTYLNWAEQSLYILQTWFDSDRGLWNSYDPSWWQSANQLTTLADMVYGGSCFASDVSKTVFPTVFLNAQASNIASGNHLKARGGLAKRAVGDGFIGDFYDDEGWWAMAWIRTYDCTWNTTYLDAAITIFDDMKNGWGNPCNPNGGEYWKKPNNFVGTISTVLFLEVAAFLANRVASSDKSNYLYWAETAWLYMNSNQGPYDQNTHLVTGDLNSTTCSIPPNSPPNFTYTDGALLGGLVELYLATQQQGYLDAANNVAQAVISHLTVNGILTEPNIDPNDPIGVQFKGIFMRGLKGLQHIAPQSQYKTFIQANADSIWNNDRQSVAYLGGNWAGPFASNPNASPQSSAMDAIVAAWLA